MSLRVLYLDDELDLCEIFIDEFSSGDVTIIAMTDSTQAIAEAQNNPPDVVFIDYRLPGTTGDAVAQAMPPHIPKYLVSGEVSVFTEYEFEGFFGKPYDRKEIGSVIESLLKGKKAA